MTDTNNPTNASNMFSADNGHASASNSNPMLAKNPSTTANASEYTVLDQYNTKSCGLPVAVHGVMRFEQNPGETKRRLVWYPLGADGQPKAYDKVTSLSLIDIDQARAGLRMFANYLAGAVSGNESIIFSAPVEKMGYQFSTGRLGFVRGDYANDFEYEVNGTKHYAVVEDKYKPVDSYAWRRILVDSGMIYNRHFDIDLTPGDRSATGYWYPKAASALLSGACISISLGQYTEEDAQGVVAMFKAKTAEEMVEANDARKFANREAGRLVGAARTELQNTTAQAQITGVTPKITSEELMVLASDGSKFDLTTWDWTKRIPLVDANDVRVNPMPLLGPSPAARRAAATAIRNSKSGLRVDLSQL